MPDDLTRLRLEQASGFASAILDARRRHERASWAPWIAHAQHEAAPLVRAVRVPAARATAENGFAENGSRFEHRKQHQQRPQPRIRNATQRARRGAARGGVADGRARVPEHRPARAAGALPTPDDPQPH